MNALVHWEIPSTDIEKSSAFYRELFGWQVRSWSQDYALFEVADGVGGGFSLVERMPAPCIQVYIEVEDIPACLAGARALGGRTVQPKTEIGGNMGFTAAFEDPCGCRIGLWSAS